MVPKHILMNSTAKSSIRRLVEYITDAQDKTSRIERINIHHCDADNPVIAARKMALLQLRNNRAKSDKTYHLLLSFPAGEEPTAEQLASIEEDMCAALGYTEHQRISVVHRDTDNLHVHVAINKIHPQKLTIHSPSRDFQILAHAAELIEKTYQLIPTNHAPKKTVNEDRVEDVQRMSGQETLAAQVRVNCLGPLQAARSWDEVHEVCRKAGIALQLRGNGLVFTSTAGNGDVLAVKASTVDRSLSKAKLENRLGTFRSSARDKNQDASVASEQVQDRSSSSPLWRRYVAARQEWQDKSVAEKERLQEERTLKKKLIDAQCRSEKMANRQSTLPYWTRQYRLLELRKEMAGKRKAFAKIGRVTGYLEWLQQQAMSGDGDALAALRRRAFGLAKVGNAFFAKGHMPLPDSNYPVDTVTKQGTVIYAIGKEIIRDRGDAFHVSADAGTETLAMAMKMAARRSGNSLTITGDDAFKEQCLQAAFSAKLDVMFTDSELEQRRKAMVAVQNQPINRDSAKGMER